MNFGGITVTIGIAVLAGSCLPAGGNFQGGGFGGGGPGSAGGPGPGVRYPLATAQEIISFVSGSSTYVETYCDTALCELECGYFWPNGDYESFSYEAYPDGTYYVDDWYEFYGSWSAQDGALCIYGQWDDGSPGPGCMRTEWNTTDDALLLINNRDLVAASITTWSGSGQYQNDCNL